MAGVLEDLDAKEAAIRPAAREKTAERQGVRLFRNVQVRAANEEVMKGRSRRTEMDPDRPAGKHGPGLLTLPDIQASRSMTR